jgi:hypothetical protein
MSTKEINQIVEDRNLNQWHLLIASLLGSLGQKGNNQGSLNLLMARSMDDFIIPFFQGQRDVDDIKTQVAATNDLSSQMNIVVEYVNQVFSLAGSMTIEPCDNKDEAVVAVESSSCRYCPIGVGKAKIDPEATFCPIPTMIEKSINFFRGDKSPVKLHLHRERASTRVLLKHDGNCYITYETA